LGYALARVGFDDAEQGLVRCHRNDWTIQDMHASLGDALRYRIATRDNVVWVFSGLAEGDGQWEQLREGIMDRLAAINRKRREVRA
jgi:hypothetical protein